MGDGSLEHRALRGGAPSRRGAGRLRGVPGRRGAGSQGTDRLRVAAAASAVLSCGLLLAGCGSDGTQPDNGSHSSTPAGSISGTATANAGDGEQKTTAELTAAVNTTTVGGTKVAVISDQTRDQLKAIADEVRSAQIDPAQCRDFALQILASNDSTAPHAVAGMSEDSDTSVALASYDSPEQARREFDAAVRAGNACSRFTLRTSGHSSSFAVTDAQAEVTAAEQSQASEVSGSLDGSDAQSAIVWALRGSELVMGQNLSSGDTGPAAEVADSLLSKLGG